MEGGSGYAGGITSPPEEKREGELAAFPVEKREGELAAFPVEKREGERFVAAIPEEKRETEWSSLDLPLHCAPNDAPWPWPVRIVGASILCMSVETRTNSLYLLLGKENSKHRWAEGGQWCDFGGGIQKGEDAEQCAAREFVEETCGMVRFFERDNTSAARARGDDIAASLRDGNFLFRLQTTFVSSESDVMVHPGGKVPYLPVYVTYVCLVPWDPVAQERFSHCRTMLGGLHKAIQRQPLTAEEVQAYEPEDTKLRSSRQRWLLQHPAVRSTLESVSLQAIQQVGRHGTLHEVMRSTHASASASERIPVVHSVAEEYMEKERIQYWSLPALQHALMHEGILKSPQDGRTEVCKKAFMTILQILFKGLDYRVLQTAEAWGGV